MRYYLAIFLSAISLYATECAEKTLSKECSQAGLYNLQNGYNVTFSGSALFWRAQEEGLDYVIRNDSGTAFANNATVKRIDFEWDWGFRLAAGYQVSDCRMDLDLTWTRFHTKDSDSTHAPFFGGLYPVWTIPGSSLTPATRARASWKLDLDMVDLRMKTTFAPRSFLELKPFIALSTAWVYQNFEINNSGGSSTQIANAVVIDDKIRMKNDFWGLGPKIGFNSMWILGRGFSILGDLDASFLYGWFDLHQKETVLLTGLSPAITFLDIDNNSFSLIRSTLHTMIGLKWDRMFACDRYHLSLEAGWETLYLFAQNQLLRFQTVSSPGINLPTRGDLTLQGLSLKAAFSF